MGKNIKANWRIFIRITIIIIPVILSFFFLFSPFEKIQLSRYNTTENMTLVRVSPEEFFNPSIKTSIQDLLQVPFNLKWYDICFKNYESKFIYSNKEEEKVNATVNFNNRVILDINNDETECVTIPFDKEFTYQWDLSTPIDLTKLTKEPKRIYVNSTHYQLSYGAAMYFNTTSYAKPNVNAIVIKNILILIAWCGLILLFGGVKKYILDGFD